MYIYTHSEYIGSLEIVTIIKTITLIKSIPDKQHHGNTMVRFLFGVRMRFFFFFSIVCSPRTVGERTPQIIKLQNCLDSIDCTMALPISLYKFYAKKHPRCI